MSATPETIDLGKMAPNEYFKLMEFIGELERERDKAVRARKDSVKDWLYLVEMADLRVVRMKRERDEALSACHIWQYGHRKMVEERDRWMELAEIHQRNYAELLKCENEAGDECDEHIRKRREMSLELESACNRLHGLEEAAQAVVDHWETPSWKDAGPTARVIYNMRDAIELCKPLDL